MTILTIIWIALPLFFGFSGYLLPKVSRILALACSVVSIAYGISRILDPNELILKLVDNFGVSLIVDPMSGFFILTNALVTTAVILYCWQLGKSKFFYTQTIILHGSVNAIFICADFLSLYVALEVIGIAAFLLIAYPRTNRAIWVGLRYLFVSNTAMLFYLIGAVLVYQANGSFEFAGLENAPSDAIALIFLGLLSKGGVFISGLWLPLTHAEADTPVSALLSGAVVKTGVFPLVRLGLMVDEIVPILQVFSVAAACLGICYALVEKDTKRMLASSTISQLGFVLASPLNAGFYALTHGLAKAALFLIAGNLPSRDLQTLQRSPLPRFLWVALLIPSLSISGLPLLAGFEAKAFTLKSLDSWHEIVMSILAVGTAIVFAKFIFLPFNAQTQSEKGWKEKPGLWLAIGLLVSGLFLANGRHLEVYNGQKLLLTFSTIGIGWLAYWLCFRRLTARFLPQAERLENLIGLMSLVLLLLFGMVIV